jgi:hypothetical protein
VSWTSTRAGLSQTATTNLPKKKKRELKKLDIAKYYMFSLIFYCKCFLPDFSDWIRKNKIILLLAQHDVKSFTSVKPFLTLSMRKRVLKTKEEESNKFCKWKGSNGISIWSILTVRVTEREEDQTLLEIEEKKL